MIELIKTKNGKTKTRRIMLLSKCAVCVTM